jgi:tetratricopeptide (TPR) repeat protein
MNKMLLKMVLVALLAASGAVQAKPVDVELVMSGGRSWKGQIVGRDGDWLEFSTGRSPKPIRIGASTVEELRFEVNIDTERLAELMQNRQYELIISALQRSMAPYAEYSDLPSNLTKYKMLLMELYYRTQQYDQSLAISSKVADDGRDPVLQEKARIYQALALIGSGRSDEAEALLAKYGWDKQIGDDADPEKLFVTAKLMALNKNYNQAMELVAKIIAFNSQNTQWMRPAELLCAEIYTELGAENPVMYESAAEVVREILMLYRDTMEYDKAMELKDRIERLRAESALNETLESE